MSNYSDSSFSKDPNSSWYKILQYIKKDSKVLDVGCSSGNFGKVLMQEKNCTVDGIELDEADVKLAKANLRSVFHLNIETDDLSSITDTYDYIYFGDVIEHLFYPAATLRRIRDLFTPQGELLFSIPNMAHLSTRLMLLRGDFQYGETGLLDKTHLHFYTVAEVERILDEANYKLINFDPVLKDFPKDLIAQELKAVGLKPTKAFIDFTRTTEASIYQIVGAATPNKTAKKKVSAKLLASSPVDNFQSLLDQTKDHYERQLKVQTKHIDKIEKYAKETVDSYQKALDEIVIKNEEINRLNTGIVKRVARKVKHHAGGGRKNG